MPVGPGGIGRRPLEDSVVAAIPVGLGARDLVEESVGAKVASLFAPSPLPLMSGLRRRQEVLHDPDFGLHGFAGGVSDPLSVGMDTQVAEA